jgi:hypothetical protein
VSFRRETPERTRCVHCGQALAVVTGDHVFPKSWYPETTPSNVQRWTVPSCGKCNNMLGNIERELFVRLALCVDPRKAEASGLSAKAVRSMGIRAEGITFEERLRRKALKRKILRSMVPYKPGSETFPGLGPHPEFSEPVSVALTLPEEQIRAVAKKIVRGCEYVLANRIVEPPYELEIFFAHKRDVADKTARVFESLGAKTTHLGPGFIVTRAEAHDEPGPALYKIVVWGTIVIYGAILLATDFARITAP